LDRLEARIDVLPTLRAISVESVKWLWAAVLENTVVLAQLDA